MTGIAEQRDAAERPARQRQPVEQRPFEGVIGGRDDAAQLDQCRVLAAGLAAAGLAGEIQ